MPNILTEPEHVSRSEALVLRNYDERILQPIGPVGIITHQLEQSFSDAVNFHLCNRRALTIAKYPEQRQLAGYYRSEYRIPVSLKRFNSGEGHATILDTVRGHDLFIVTDVLNYGQSYIRYNQKVSISPDEHFEDLCRLISAAHGVSKRINVVMPYLYQGRRYRRDSRESLDCAVMLNRLFELGISNFVTFDAHDERIANAVPRHNFESAATSFQLIEALLSECSDLQIDKDHFMVISADEASISRCIYYASVLRVPLGIFYRKYDPRLLNRSEYTLQKLKRTAEKKFLGENISGKDVLIVDDMIDSGKTVLECAEKLKAQDVRRVFIAVSFAQFSEGIENFNEAYDNGLINKVFATNLSYQPPALLETEWFCDVNLAKYLALLIDGINHDASLSKLINPTERIYSLLNSFKGDKNGQN
ncbi:MAG: ribose-phosphate diphosphokinase [Clostridiaceae bacterium]|nr:ribose-phosphate diphosphokinase [Clostridiaceae bacterium]